MGRDGEVNSVDVLRKAHDLLEVDGAWMKGEYFKNADFEEVPFRSGVVAVEEVAHYCLVGAVELAGLYLCGTKPYDSHRESIISEAEDWLSVTVSTKFDGKYLTSESFNDNAATDLADVLILLDHTITHAEVAE
jgi:hypothetical protein